MKNPSLLARLCIVAVVYCMMTADAHSQVYINEVLWPGSPVSTADEWLELYVAEQTDVSHWYITTLSSGEHKEFYRFASGSVLGADSYWVLSNFAADASALLLEPNAVDAGISLPNSKLQLQLLDPQDRVIDTADDGSGVPLAGYNASGTGVRASMERINYGAGDNPLHWQSALEAIGLDEAAGIFGTPGYPNTSPIINPEPEPEPEPEPDTPKPKIRISEVLANPVGPDDTEWIELHNTGTEAVDASAVALQDSSRSYPLTGVVLQPNEYRIFTKATTGISLTNTGEEVQLLFNSEVLDRLEYPETGEGISYGILDDELRPFCIPSPDAENTNQPIQVRIDVQSSNTELAGNTLIAEERVTANLQVVAQQGSIVGATCTWDYGNGHTSSQCNPPSHTYTEIGEYVLSLSVDSYCGNTVEQELDISVLGSQKEDIKAQENSDNVVANPGPQPTADIAIELSGVLPNPEGKDVGREWVELRGIQSKEGNLIGWSLDDGSDGNKAYVFPDTPFDPNETIRLYGDETGLTLTNTDGMIVLLKPDGSKHSMLAWTKAIEGYVYRPVRVREQKVRAYVTEVIDGDTLKVQFTDLNEVDNLPEPLQRKVLGKADKEFTVRLLGIDAPETVHPDIPEQWYGRQAAEKLQDIVENATVELEFDTELYDAHNRLLAYIYMNKLFVQEELLTGGYAKAYITYPFARSAEFSALAGEAEKQGVGLWGSEEEAIEEEEAEKIEYLVPFISEVYPAPLSGEGEWVELFNPYDEDIPLADWRIDDIRDGGSSEQVVADGVLEPDSYTILEDLGLNLNNGGDELWLIAPDNSVQIGLEYEKLKKGTTLIFCTEDNCQEGNQQPEEQCQSQAPTPGLRNTCREVLGVQTQIEAVIPKATAAQPKAEPDADMDWVASQRGTASISVKEQRGMTLELMLFIAAMGLGGVIVFVVTRKRG